MLDGKIIICEKVNYKFVTLIYVHGENYIPMTLINIMSKDESITL